MKLLSKYIFSALFLAASGGSATAQSMRANTYCNPLARLLAFDRLIELGFYHSR